VITKTLPDGLVSTSRYDHSDRLYEVDNPAGTTSFSDTLDPVDNPTLVSTTTPMEAIHYHYYADNRVQKACYDVGDTCSGTGLDRDRVHLRCRREHPHQEDRRHQLGRHHMRLQRRPPAVMGLLGWSCPDFVEGWTLGQFWVG
jgi:hypothetical protein